MFGEDGWQRVRRSFPPAARERAVDGGGGEGGGHDGSFAGYVPSLEKAAALRSGSLAHHENITAQADEKQVARAVLAEGGDPAERPRVGREILVPPRETRRRKGQIGRAHV